MEYSLDSYRTLARQCAAAHRHVMTGDCNVAMGRETARHLFVALWERLDREDALDRYNATQTFNGEFARAYRGHGYSSPDRNDWPAYMLSTAERYECSNALRDEPSPADVVSPPTGVAPSPDVPPVKPSPKSPVAKRHSAALDCAAFYAAKAPA